MKRTTNIGLAFVDAYGLRNLSFQLVDESIGKAIACVDIVEGDVIRFLSIYSLLSKRKAIERLAQIHAKRAKYQSFRSNTAAAVR